MSYLNKPLNATRPKWILDEAASQPLVERLLLDAQTVCRQIEKYEDDEAFQSARRKKSVPAEFWKALARLNEALARFAHIPFINVEAAKGRLIGWTPTDDSPVAHLTRQLTLVLRLLDDDAVLKVRRCRQCGDWFFARFRHQSFCEKSCQQAEFSKSDAFRKHRAAYMRARRHK